MTPARQPADFATLIRDFFCDRLVKQQNVSPHTVAAYRDTFRLLLEFLSACRHRPPSELTLAALDARTILAFLDHLENKRGNAVRTRNARMTAVRAFVTYASTRDPTILPQAQQLLAIPRKRFNRPLLGHLTRPEMEAVLAAPDLTTWSGRRDRALFTLMYNTGARVSEAIGGERKDLQLGPASSVRIHGKGRKDRTIPIWRSTAKLLTTWLIDVDPSPTTPLFPNRFGRRLSRSGVEDRLEKAVTTATQQCSSLANKAISPHTLRHTTAMHLLQAGVDVTLIALWLGHESTETTHQYVEADVEMKQRVLNRLEAPPTKSARRPKVDKVFDFLNRL